MPILSRPEGTPLLSSAVRTRSRSACLQHANLFYGPDLGLKPLSLIHISASYLGGVVPVESCEAAAFLEPGAQAPGIQEKMNLRPGGAPQTGASHALFAPPLQGGILLGRFHLGLTPQALEMPLLRSYSAGAQSRRFCLARNFSTRFFLGQHLGNRGEHGASL